MKILVLTEQWFPDFTGGSGRVATDTSVQLAKKGHEVTVIAPVEDRSQPRYAEPSSNLFLHRIVERGRVVPQTVSDPSRFKSAIKTLSGRSFDLVVAHQPSGVEAGRLVDAPTAFVFHASGLREAKHRRQLGVSTAEALRSRVVELPLSVLENRSTKNASLILVLSEFSRGLLEVDHPHSEQKIRVAGGGVDTTSFTPSDDRTALRSSLGLGEDDRVLVTVRRLVARTGVDVLLRAFAQLKATDPKLRLVIIGDGEDRGQLEALNRELGPKDVTFLGRASDQQVLDWYRASDLFVLPTVAYEGFGLSTAEALACGTPVVGTPVGATAELLRPLDPSRVSLSASPTDLSETVRTTLARLKPEHRLAARVYAEASLSLEAMAQRWEREFLDLLGRPGEEPPAAS